MLLIGQPPQAGGSLYMLLKDFQPLIGAMLALITLAVGARIKFGYDRRMDRLARAARRHALHSSLYMETLLLAHHVGELGDFVLAYADPGRPLSRELLDIYQLPVPVVYDAVVKDVGEMDDKVAGDFISFYAHYKRLVQDMPLLVRDVPDRGFDHILRLILETVNKAKAACASVDALINRGAPSLPDTTAIDNHLKSRAAAPETNTPSR